VSHDVRDEVVDFIRYWSERTELAARRLVRWIGIGRSKYYEWRERYGKVNEHNAWIPRDFWLEAWEEEAIVSFYREHPREGYRRLTYRMLDADIVALSLSSVYRVLKRRDLLVGDGIGRHRGKDTALSSRFSPTSIGTRTFRISTFAGHSTTCVPFWTATAATSCTAKSEKR
jgi:hypothetical protein